MGKTKIEWADETINFYDWACRRVSPGCDNCYARALAQRHGKIFDKTPEWRERAVDEWRRVKPGSVVFINSMSDTWHEGVTLEMIQCLYAHLATRPDVTALVLTKRIQRAEKYQSQIDWPANVWIGTSIEDAQFLYRARRLANIDAPGRFISAEPLLGSLLTTPYYGDQVLAFMKAMREGLINWVIAGGESGPKRRYFDADWARELRDLCGKYGVPFMFKQGGGLRPGMNRELDGRTWDETPFTQIGAPADDEAFEQPRLL